MTTRTDDVRSIRDARDAIVERIADDGGDALVATGRLGDFRCTFAKVGDEGRTIGAAGARALGIDAGATISFVGRI